MSSKADDKTFGTAEQSEPVSRADFERALRFVNSSHVDVHDMLLRLAAQVVALTDELVRRIDHVEPQPAQAGTPARDVNGTVEESVVEAVPETLAKIRAAEIRHTPRVWLELDPTDKYATSGPDVPCAELIHICQSRCCKLQFPLSTRDLDEGVIRWDYGKPYMIRQRASDGKCVHNDPSTHFCTVHAQRPAVCRKYDCRTDARIWADYDKRILATAPIAEPSDPTFDLMERVQQRANAVLIEDAAVYGAFPEETPRVGPAPSDGTRMHPRRPPSAL